MAKPITINDKLFAGIIIDQAHPSLDRVFYYRVPEELRDKIQLGMRVMVPFGVSNKKIEGYVISLEDTVDIPLDKIKLIAKIMDDFPMILPEFIPIIQWMKKEYHCLTIEALRCFITPGLRMNVREKRHKVVYLIIDKNINKCIETVEKRSHYMAEILRILDQDGDGIPLAELSEMAGGAPMSSFRNLERRGWIKIVDEEIYRNPWDDSMALPQKIHTLTPRQEQAVEEIEKGLLKARGNYLLHGVTGSGKTEVYMQVVQKALEMGKQAIVLVPEISLTPQTVERFKHRFEDQVAILHSALSVGERYDEWRKVYNQEVNIVVGARSAIFAPFKRLGVIIIDEAHEDTYKSDGSPRYNAVGVAKKRCELEGAVLVLGTATPSLEDYYRAQNNEYKLLTLEQRIDNKPLPEVEVVDMRKELEKGNRSIFSHSLYKSIEQVLNNGEQGILLLNRRGYAQFVSCRSCGYVVRCRNCDISLTYHFVENVLKCHYCGEVYPYPKICPSCRSKYIKYFGIGTQRIEEEIKKFFPAARVIRMDVDTTSTKGAHQRILNAFRKREYDFLLGTQMVAKGLDFPMVTLVGVIAADLSLNLPDYRSSEKTFQLITQVAGRAGRGDRKGRVIIQTYQPEHYAIQYASRHDYHGFFKREIQVRHNFEYPPFSHIIRILVTGEEEKSVITLAKSIDEWIRGAVEADLILKQGLLQFGAFPAPLEKIRNKYRWHVLLKIRSDSMFIEKYHQLVDECLKNFRDSSCTVVVDFYPLSLL